MFQFTHSSRSATDRPPGQTPHTPVSIHALLAECDNCAPPNHSPPARFNPRTPCGVRRRTRSRTRAWNWFQSTHSLRSATTPQGVRRGSVDFLSGVLFLAECDHSARSATAADLIHCYSTEQIILCANLPKKTVIARLHFLSIYLSIFYSQCITPIADLPGNSCELEVGAQAMFNSL